MEHIRVKIEYWWPMQQVTCAKLFVKECPLHKSVYIGGGSTRRGSTLFVPVRISSVWLKLEFCSGVFYLCPFVFSLPQRGGVGEKFFESTANTSVLKRMKKQLNDASDYHHQKVTELDQREKCQVSGLSYVGRCGYQFSIYGE